MASKSDSFVLYYFSALRRVFAPNSTQVSLPPHPPPFLTPNPSTAMRIRRRPPFPSLPSFTTPTPPPFQDPSFHLPPLAPNGRDASANHGGAAKGAPELHPDGHPREHPHGFAQDLNNRRTPDLHPPPPPPPPCLDPFDETSGRSIHSSSTHLTDVGHGKAQDFMEEEKSEGERDILVESKKRWDDAQQVNSNKRIDGSSGASILLEAARQLEAAATTNRKKVRGESDDDDDCGGFDKKLKEKKKSKAKERPSGRGGADGSLRNNCTSVNVKDNDGCMNGDGPVAVMEEDKGGVAVNGSGPSNGKRRRSPAVLMEGSRCSRVNGRGWRCCQQTLVGYSLCEHHLGKGRLRSVSSVRGQIGATTRPKRNSKTTTASFSPTGQEEEDEEKRAVQLQQPRKNEALEVDGTDMEKEIEGGGENSEDKVTEKRRKKMGTVKARSISSLLDDELSVPAQLPAQSFILGNYN